MRAVSRITPWLNSISSPGLTSLLGFAGVPLTFTRPPRIASTASARVLTRRAAHSHLSMRTGLVSIVVDILTQPSCWGRRWRYMKSLIAPLALAAVALSPGVALAHSKTKVYTATFQHVGAE